MLTLYIGNKNYSSWSMRPWVLLRQSGIAFEEVMVRFDAFTPDSQFKQRLVIYPNLSDRGEYRAAFDAGLSVAMSGSLSLQTTLGLRVNSDPGTGLKKTDTLLFTGITYKYE